MILPIKLITVVHTSRWASLVERSLVLLVVGEFVSEFVRLVVGKERSLVLVVDEFVDKFVGLVVQIRSVPLQFH